MKRWNDKDWPQRTTPPIDGLVAMWAKLLEKKKKVYSVMDFFKMNTLDAGYCYYHVRQQLKIAKTKIYKLRFVEKRNDRTLRCACTVLAANIKLLRSMLISMKCSVLDSD